MRGDYRLSGANRKPYLCGFRPENRGRIGDEEHADPTGFILQFPRARQLNAA